MTPIIRSITKAITGPSDKDIREQRAAETQASADQARLLSLAQQKESEGQVALKKAKKKQRTVGRRSTILTSPLGTVDSGLTTTLG